MIHLVSRLGHWGYLAIFLAVSLEAGAFLGFLVPGETLVLLGGFLAAQGVLDLGDLIVLVCVGAVIGDSIGYEMGRHFGRGWLVAHGRWIGLTEARLHRVDEFFSAHGGKAVLIGRFSAFLRAMTPFIAGASRMRYRRFLLYNATGGIVWSVAFVLLGYFLGASWHLVERWAGRASAIAAGIIVLLLLAIWLSRWLIRHEALIKERWARFLEWPRVLALRQRLAPQVDFLIARLTPGGYLGLYLTVGALVLVAALWVFGGIAQDVVAGDPLTVVDRHVAVWLHAHATPPVTWTMLTVSYLGSWMVVTGIVTALALAFLARRRWYRLLALLVAVPGGALLNVVLKLAFHRHRPVFGHPLAILKTYSFPSGHATLSMLLYGLLAVFAVRWLRSWRWRVLAVLTALLLVVLIGFSRIYLGVHYLSDILGGYAEGVAWLAICLTAVETLRRSRMPGGTA